MRFLMRATGRKALRFSTLLFFAFPAQAEPLKIATWNLNWLTQRPAGDHGVPKDVVPRGRADFERLRAYAVQLDADVVALQEVDGPEVAARVFTPDRYALHFTHDRVAQRVGFAIRRTIKFRSNPDLVELDVNENGGRHLRSGADVTLLLKNAELRLLAVHLKSGCRDSSLERSKRRECAVLSEQVAPLAGWVAQRQIEKLPFAVMGDFNRWMRPNDALFGALAAPGPLARPTEGTASPCWGSGQFIDHILIGGLARAWLDANSLRVLVYRESDPAMKEKISDHCPVSVRLNAPD